MSSIARNWLLNALVSVCWSIKGRGKNDVEIEETEIKGGEYWVFWSQNRSRDRDRAQPNDSALIGGATPSMIVAPSREALYKEGPGPARTPTHPSFD